MIVFLPLNDFKKILLSINKSLLEKNFEYEYNTM